jgi:hypothetical protein
VTNVAFALYVTCIGASSSVLMAVLSTHHMIEPPGYSSHDVTPSICSLDAGSSVTMPVPRCWIMPQALSSSVATAENASE